MAVYPRRFRVWPRENLIGRARPAAYAEGCLFTDGSVAVRYSGAVTTSVVYLDHGIDAILSGTGWGGEADIEWLDGQHG